jgi:DNA-binding cell septation regulator SpoVG
MKKITKLLFIISLFLCYFANSFAGELKITKIDIENNEVYTIIVNNSFVLYNLVLKVKNGKSSVEFPVYAGNGKIYNQFSVLKRDYNEYLVSSIKAGKESFFEGSTGFKINKFSIYKNPGNIKAFASVIFEDVLEVECRIMQGSRGLWIAWPANKRSGKWAPDFEFADKDLKKRVESALIEKYNKEDERK